MVTIVLLVSRAFLLERIATHLNKMYCDRDKTNLLVIVDGDINLFLKCRNLFSSSLFAQKLIVRANEPTRRSNQQSFRRSRIAYLHNFAKQHIEPTDYILTIEDDGIFPLDGLEKLLAHYADYPDAGFISGLEVGRWTTPYIGGWIIKNHEDPEEIQSVTVEQDLQPISAAGLYFCLTKYENYMSVDFNPTTNWGPDIVWGNELCKKGKHNYMDTTIIVDHYRENGTIVNPSNTPVRTTHMAKKNGTWRHIFKVSKV